jgi:hypothetical protein
MQEHVLITAATASAAQLPYHNYWALNTQKYRVFAGNINGRKQKDYRQRVFPLARSLTCQIHPYN